MSLRFLILGACAGVTGLLAGCASVPGHPPVVVECKWPAPDAGGRSGPALVGQAYGMQHTPLPLNSVQFDGYGTASRVAVQALAAERTATDTVEVTVRLVSCSDVPQAVRMRTNFMRPNQAPAEPTSAWRVVHLSPRAMAHYSEMSTSRNVGAYIVEIAGD